jgi:tol-pal system protein YbgF
MLGLIEVIKNFRQLIFRCFFIIIFLPQISTARSSISELENRLEGLENKLDSNVSFEISSKVEFLQKEIQELRGIIEEQQNLIYNLTKEHNPKVGSSTANNVNSGSSLSPALETAPIPKKQLQPEQAAYNAAYKLIEDKNFTGALVAFKDFLSQYNNSKYAANATYWVGELYLIDHNFDVAADYFLRVIDQYKDHDKAPDALLKLGMLEIERENWQGAKNYFLKIKKDYANSPRVQMAEAKLKGLERDGH